MECTPSATAGLWSEGSALEEKIDGSPNAQANAVGCSWLYNVICLGDRSEANTPRANGHQVSILKFARRVILGTRQVWPGSGLLRMWPSSSLPHPANPTRSVQLLPALPRPATSISWRTIFDVYHVLKKVSQQQEPDSVTTNALHQHEGAWLVPPQRLIEPSPVC